MDRTLQEHVWQRASACCKYCQLPQPFSETTHEKDHIIAEKHRGQTTLNNLALACFACNNHKGPNIAGIDPLTGNTFRLYHPRVDVWHQHFRWNGGYLEGLKDIGRVTILVLEINLHHRVLHRFSLWEEGLFPPTFDPAN